MSSSLEGGRSIPVLQELDAAQLRDFVETATLGLHAIGPDGTILWANEADHRLLGYTREEYVGRSIAEFHVDPANLDGMLACLTRGERLVNHKATLRHKDGSVRHVLIDSSGHFEDGKFVHTRCFTRDITQLTEQAELHEALIRAQTELGDGIVLCDDERVYWANDAYAELVGYSLPEILDEAFQLPQRLAPEERSAAEARSEERASGAQLLHRYEATLVRKDGTRVPCECSVKTLEKGAHARRICVVRDITKRRTAEAELRDQRDLYRALVSAQSDLEQGVLLWREGRLTYANDAFAKMLGRALPDVLSPEFDITEQLAPDERERLSARIRLEDPRRPLHYEARFVRADGRTITAEVASLGVELDGGIHRLALFRDVTAQRETERRIQDRDAFLTHATLKLLETTLDPNETMNLVAELATGHLGELAGIELLDDDGRLRRVALRHVDASKEALIAPHRGHVQANPALRGFLEGLPKGSVSVSNDIPAAAFDAYSASADDADLARSLAIRHALVVPLWGHEGLLGAITIGRSTRPAFTDEDAFVAKSLGTRAAFAFENAILHERSQRLEREARALSERHQRTLDTAPVQVLTIDAEGRILSINRSMAGGDPTRVIGLNAFDVVVPAERERVRELVFESMRTNTPVEYETEGLVEGIPRWFQVRVGPLAGARGAVLVSTDITDRKVAAKEVAAMRAQLIRGEKLSALGSLVSGVAHELRTPLTFLANNAFLLKRAIADAAKDGKSAAEAWPSVELRVAEIDGAIDRINALVGDLRRYTKARSTPTLVARRLDEVAAEPIELFRATNRAAHDVQLDLRRTSMVRLDPGAVQQVVLNLLQNAADASPSGATIRVATRDDESDVVLEVQDRGPGIPPEVQERMYEPLFTTKPEGSGLGLSIVKRIVDEHAARIACESSPQGTTFRVHFPKA